MHVLKVAWCSHKNGHDTKSVLAPTRLPLEVACAHHRALLRTCDFLNRAILSDEFIIFA